MAEIGISRTDGNGYEVTISEGGSKKTCLVELDEGYYRKLTNGTMPEVELIRRSFLFLLEREPKESILPEFHLSEIGRYFPEYERELQRSRPG